MIRGIGRPIIPTDNSNNGPDYAYGRCIGTALMSATWLFYTQ